MATVSSQRKVFKIFFLLLVYLSPMQKVFSAAYGSDTAVSIVNPFNITGPDNIIKTFGCAINGFAFVDSTASCSFNSVYPVAGPISLRGGRLYLQRDLILTNTGSLADLGTIIGQNHAVDLSQSSNTFASVTNPTGARTLALIARTTATRVIYSLDWSYDNKYLAAVITSGTGNELLIYSFNGTTLTLRTGVNLSGNGTSVRWRPGSYYLAASSDYTSGKIRVYLYNSTTNTLTLKSTQNPTGTFYAVGWQGRGNYLAAGGTVVQVYHFNTGTETLDVNYTPTNNAALNGNVTYDCIHWAPVGNRNDFIAGTTGGSLHLYNFTGSAVNHLKRYDQGTGIESLDWAPTSTYMALGFLTGSIKTYQHATSATPSANIITYKNASVSIPSPAYSLSWKPNATELTVGFQVYSGYEHQIFSFNSSTYALTNAYNIEVGNGVYCIRYSNTNGTYIARADNGTRYLSIYKENYSPFIFQDVHLFLNSNLTIGTPITLQGNCTINGRGNNMTFTGDGTINVATNSKLNLSNSSLFFKQPNAFALQGKTSQLVFDDVNIGLGSNIIFGDGAWETYNDVNVTGPYTFAYSTANTSTVHADSYLTFNNGATFQIGKTQQIRSDSPQPLEFENNSAHLSLDNATLHVTNSGLLLKKGIVDVYNKSNFFIDFTDKTVSKTSQGLAFGDGTASINSPTIILHGNGTELTISNGAIVLDGYQTPTMLQFDGQAQMTLVDTLSLYFKQPVALINGWIRPSTDIGFSLAPNAYVTADNVRFDYTDIIADYNITGTLIDPLDTLLDYNDSIFVNRGNSVESLIIKGKGASVSGLGGPLGSITLADNTVTFTWNVAGEFGEQAIYLNGGRIAVTQNVFAAPGFSFQGTGTVDISDRTFELGTAATNWDGNIYWASNGGVLKLNNNVTLSGIWTLSGNLLIDGQNYLIDLDKTGTIILERDAKVTFQNISLYNISRKTPITCRNNNCEITLNIADFLLSGDYLFDKGSLFVYYNSTLGTIDGLDHGYTFTYASTQTSTIDTYCYFKVLPNTRFSIGRQNSTITNPDRQPLVFNDPLTSKLILAGGTLHVTSSGMRLTKGTVEIQNTSNIEVETPKYEYGLILGDGTLNNDVALTIDPGVQLNINRGRIFYQNKQDNRITFASPASSINIQSPQGFSAKTWVNFNSGWFKFNVNMPFYIDPSVHITLDNQRFEYPARFYDYTVSGTLIDSSNIILASDDFIAVTRGNSIENVLISGRGAQLTGVGGPLGTITLADNTASLTWDVSGELGINTINLNGGKFTINQNVVSSPGFTFVGTGTVDVGPYFLELGTAATDWTGNIYWAGNGGSLKLNSDVTLSGIVTFSGNIIFDGQGSIIDLDQTGTIILERGAQFEFRNTSVNNLSRQTPIVCSDNNCQITLNFVSLLLSSDYVFDKGSLYIYYDSLFGILDGLDGIYTFTYASTQTSTIESEANLEIWPNTRFSIGRQNSLITDPEQQPLVFVDPLTSKILLQGGTLHITSSGMILTKGTLEVQNTSNIEVATPKYEYGLVLGDGTPENDFLFKIDPGAQLNIKTGTIFYQNSNDNRIVFTSPASSIDSFSPSGFWAKKNILFKDGTIITDNSTGIATSYDPGITVNSESITRITRGGVTYSVKKLTLHGGIRPYNLLNGDSYYVTEGFATDDVIAKSGTSYFGGPAGFGGTLAIHDQTATLQTELMSPMACNIPLNGGTLAVAANTFFADDHTITGSGKVTFFGTDISFGNKETSMTSTIYWQGLISGGICLNSKTSLSSTWTFGGLMQLNGNGNVLDLSNRGVLTIRPGATLDLENIAIKGLGSGKGNINFMSDSSTLKLSNAYLELDNNFTTTIGGILVDGPTTVGTKNYNWLFDQKASMTIDGVTLWQDPLDKTKYGKITFGSGPRSKYLSLVSSGTIKTATNLDLVTQSTADLAIQIRTNSNTLLYLDRIDSNAKLFLTKNNSNTLRYLSRINSNAQLYCCRTTSNALLYGDRTNSNAIIKLNTTVRTNSNTQLYCCRTMSNALLYGDRVNSNAIVYLSGQSSTLNRTTSNALLYCCRITSAALLYGNRTNSNAIIRLDRTVRTNSNAFARGIRNNSNAIVKLSSTVTQLSTDLDELGDLVNENSNAIIKLDRTVRTNSNALLYCCRITSNALRFGDRTSSNTQLYCCRTMSNALLYGDRVNSNAIVYLSGQTSTLSRTTSNALLYCCRTTSAALLYGDRTNSNAIIKLDRNIRTNSNYMLFGDRINSNTLLYLDRIDSNAKLFLTKNNSNAIVKLDRNIRTNSNTQLYCCRTMSNALLYGDRVNSNAIVYLSGQSTTLNRTTSNALLYCCRTTSAALLYGNRTNSNAIIKLDRNIRTNSNYMLFGDRINSNTLLYLDRIDSNAKLFLTKNNSNAIVKLDRNVRTNSNTQLYCCRTMSNALLYGDRVNSNAIIKISTGGDSELARTTSNALLYCCRTTSAALLLGDRVNSNAILSICVTTSNQFVINNSNAIVWLNRQLQTIDHGPTNINITTNYYQLISDIFLSNNHSMNIFNNSVINGNGHSIYLACPAIGVIDIAAGSTVFFQNIAFRNYTDAAFNLGAGASIIFGDGVNLELLQAQALERQWTFTGNSRICGNENELAIDSYAIEVAPHSALTIHGVALTELKNSNLHGDDDTSSITLSEVDIYLDHNFTITKGALIFDPDVVIVGTNIFTYASSTTSSIARDSQLYMSGITFRYEPPVANRDLFAMVDQSSRLFIDGCTLSATITGMRLTRGTLIADHKNFLDNAGATSISEGFAFGDGDPDHDLSIEVKPGGSLNLVAGQWDYQNSNA